jgi:hypothetical protein
VDRAPRCGRRALLHHGADQRVAEVQARRVADDHVRCQRLLEPGRGAARRLDRRLEGFERRLRERRHVPEHGAGVRRERRETPGEQPADVRGRLGAGRADELERHQRIARARVVKPREGGRGQPLAGPRVHETAEVGGVERWRRQLQRLVGGQGPHEGGEGLVRLTAAHGGEHLRAAGLDPPDHERQDRQRGRIQPLPVVDREDHGSGQPGEQREAREADQSRVDGIGRVLEQERRRQRAPLRHRQPRQPIDHGSEQVVQGGERAAGLGRGRPRPEHERARV